MELLYLYIGGREKIDDPNFKDLEDTPYKVFKNIELNFSNEFIFTFDKGTKQLHLAKNDLYVPNFFDKNGVIKDITGIIGKNGTGKSSILELIKALRKDNFKDIFYKIIAVFGEGNTYDIYFHPELEFTPETDIIDLKPFFNESRKISTKGTDYGSLPEYLVVYYSNLFEVNPTGIKNAYEIYGDSNISDISTINLLQTDAGNQTNLPSKNMNSDIVIRRHKLMETERQAIFFLNIKSVKEYLDFIPPKILELTIDHVDERIIKEMETNPYNSLIQGLDHYIPKNKYSPKENFIYYLHRAALFNTIRYFINNRVPFKDFNKILDDDLKRDGSPISIRKFLNKLGDDFESHLKQHGIIEENPISNQLFLLSSFLDDISNMPESHFKIYAPEDPKLYLDINLVDEFSLISKYFKQSNLTGFVVLDWRFSIDSTGQMSSGEKALVNLYSRFYYVYRNCIKYGKKDSLLILMDEADQLFHPEWQRKFLSRFLKFVKEIFDFAKTIQIILTTHSPFITSDLPPYSIIKLNKVDLATTVEKVKLGQSTFAANIHELFTDSFYLEHGLVGEFSIEKVKEMFDSLNNLNNSNLAYIQKQIDLVGEPFVKMSLNELLNSKSK